MKSERIYAHTYHRYIQRHPDESSDCKPKKGREYNIKDSEINNKRTQTLIIETYTYNYRNYNEPSNIFLFLCMYWAVLNILLFTDLVSVIIKSCFKMIN